MLLIIKLPFWCYWIQLSKSTCLWVNQVFHFNGDEDSVCHCRFSMLWKALWIVGKSTFKENMDERKSFCLFWISVFQSAPTLISLSIIIMQIVWRGWRCRTGLEFSSILLEGLFSNPCHTVTGAQLTHTLLNKSSYLRYGWFVESYISDFVNFFSSEYDFFFLLFKELELNQMYEIPNTWIFT